MCYLSYFMSAIPGCDYRREFPITDIFVMQLINILWMEGLPNEFEVMSEP